MDSTGDINCLMLTFCSFALFNETDEFLQCPLSGIATF